MVRVKVSSRAAQGVPDPMDILIYSTALFCYLKNYALYAVVDNEWNQKRR